MYEVLELAAGARHTCLAFRDTAAGQNNIVRVTCWGDSSQNRLGFTLNPNRLSPCGEGGLGLCHFVHDIAGSSGNLGRNDAVPGLVNPNQLTAGQAHTCAASGELVERGVVCWGDNTHSQLGAGPAEPSGTVNVALPAPAPGVTRRVIAALEAGERHTCAAVVDVVGAIPTGSIVCWGANEAGQSGADAAGDAQPTTVFSAETGLPLVPARASVGGGEGATNLLALGARHSCALVAEPSDPLTAPAGVACWGSDAHGQVLGGDGGARAVEFELDWDEADLPLRGIQAGGDTVCVWSATRLACWGLNRDHQLGQGEPLRDEVPAVVVGVENATELWLGGRHGCARESSGDLKCWGANAHGQAVPGAPEIVPVATSTWESDGPPVSGLMRAVALGGEHSCAAFEQGVGDAVFCWGDASMFQTYDEGDPFAEVAGVDDVLELSAGAEHTCALGDRGGALKVTCWGANDAGQLGNTDAGPWCDPFEAPPCRPPVPVGYDGDVSRLEVGGGFACAAEPGGAACWGENLGGVLGADADIGASSAEPRGVVLEGLSEPLRKLALGRRFVLALEENGRVWGWGDEAPALLLSSTPEDPSPALMVGRDPVLSEPVADVVAGGESACALTSEGALYCWGDNTRGQLGSGAVVGQDAAPVRVELD